MKIMRFNDQEARRLRALGDRLRPKDTPVPPDPLTPEEIERNSRAQMKYAEDARRDDRERREKP